MTQLLSQTTAAAVILTKTLGHDPAYKSVNQTGKLFPAYSLVAGEGMGESLLPTTNHDPPTTPRPAWSTLRETGRRRRGYARKMTRARWRAPAWRTSRRRRSEPSGQDRPCFLIGLEGSPEDVQVVDLAQFVGEEARQSLDSSDGALRVVLEESKLVAEGLDSLPKLVERLRGRIVLDAPEEVTSRL